MNHVKKLNQYFIEWARIMSNFGVETTVVELASHLLPIADIEV